jgi:hypothetical protein
MTTEIERALFVDFSHSGECVVGFECTPLDIVTCGSAIARVGGEKSGGTASFSQRGSTLTPSVWAIIMHVPDFLTTFRVAAMNLESPNSPSLKSSANAAAGSLNMRAVWTGAVVDIAGSLVMSTIIGIAAIMGMLTRGDSPETIVAELPGSFILAVCAGAGGLLMSLAGGYVAATIARQSQLRHATWTGIASAVLNLAMLAIIGDSGPAWLVALTTAIIVPCAMLGGWLAMPIAVPAVSLSHRPR